MSILRTARNVAIASAVHGRVQRRQHARWSQGAQPQDAATPDAAGASSGAPAVDVIDQLTKLAELKAAGVLTDAEFETQKARILAA